MQYTVSSTRGQQEFTAVVEIAQYLGEHNVVYQGKYSGLKDRIQILIANVLKHRLRAVLSFET